MARGPASVIAFPVHRYRQRVHEGISVVVDWQHVILVRHLTPGSNEPASIVADRIPQPVRAVGHGVMNPSRNLCDSLKKEGA
jgi:hypothetical protein